MSAIGLTDAVARCAGQAGSAELTGVLHARVFDPAWRANARPVARSGTTLFGLFTNAMRERGKPSIFLELARQSGKLQPIFRLWT